jgi:hypothetical protein
MNMRMGAIGAQFIVRQKGASQHNSMTWYFMNPDDAGKSCDPLLRQPQMLHEPIRRYIAVRIRVCDPYPARINQTQMTQGRRDTELPRDSGRLNAAIQYLATSP